MKIVMLTIGTRGEVQPLVALGLGLQAAGHQVVIATHGMFETFVREAGLGFSLIRFDPQEFLSSETGQAILNSGRNPARTFRIFVSEMKAMVLGMDTDCWAACQEAGVILYTIGGFYFAPHLAEKLDAPAIGVYLYPTSQPTRAFPNPFIPMQRNLGGPLNFLTHLIIEMMSWLPLRSIINQWRREQLGLPPASVNYPQQRRRQKAPMLFGFSPHVVPKPADWGDHIHVTGYWFLDQSADWQPPADLLDFLAAGPPPVFVGFGSMPSGNAEEMTDLVLQALARTKQRGLISTGGGDLSLADLPDHVFKVGIIPYEWLFPQMAAVVHHGGSGTTAISLQAGIPSIILPFFMDQPFWGQRVADLGVGPQPIPRKYLSIERLAAAITVATTDPEMQCRAIMLGEHIRAEDGVAKAVEAINRYLLSP